MPYHVHSSDRDFSLWYPMKLSPTTKTLFTLQKRWSQYVEGIVWYIWMTKAQSKFLENAGKWIYIEPYASAIEMEEPPELKVEGHNTKYLHVDLPVDGRFIHNPPILRHNYLDKKSREYWKLHLLYNNRDDDPLTSDDSDEED